VPSKTPQPEKQPQQQRETKTYGHFCMLARTMELLDDRWTVLVIRDLLLGRRRFTDLERRLGGITAKTLQQRLVDLESNGLLTVDREPGRRDVWYELTPSGMALSTPLDELTAWGLRYFKRPPMPGEPTHSEHLVSALRIVLERGAPPPRPVTWRFVFDGGSARALRFDDNMWTYIDGDPGVADLTISATTAAFAAFLTSFPGERQAELEQLSLNGTKLNQKLFVRLTDRFPFGLDQ
jgi:DNA-binding HxlR family transcriptional regulator